MSIEGIGRRRPQQDIEKDIQQGQEDFVFEQHQRNAAALIELARPIDERDKALTGRKMEDYMYESAIMQDELFPQDGNILNIGDPWQTLDRQGITNLEYATGEEASFVSNAEVFFKMLEKQFTAIEHEIKYIATIQPKVAESIRWKLNSLREFLQMGLSVQDYPKIAQVAQQIAREFAELVPDVYNRYPNPWYAAIDIARGFSDLHLTEKVIQPILDKEAIERKGLTEKGEQELRRQLIEKYRGQKKYKESELVKGAFPNTDFDNNSFDRITASWSISAHMFGVMDAKHFSTTWKETDRLLRKDGAAYFWPINYQFDDPSELFNSVETYTKAGGMVGVIVSQGDNQEKRVIWYNQDNADTIARNWYKVQTLVVLSRRHNSETMQRVENNLFNENIATVEANYAA